MANPVLTVVPNHKISGWLREVNLERNTCQIFSGREPINCSFDVSLKRTIVDALEAKVNAYGEAALMGGNGHRPKIEMMYIQELEVVGVDDETSPGKLTPMRALLEAGAIRPLPGSEEIGDSVAYIRRLRENDYK